MTPRAALQLAALAMVAVALLHGATLWIGLHHDAYVILHPWSAAELWQAVTSNWIPGIDPYHRPIDPLIFAAQFAAFGLNAVALHAVSLVGVALATGGLGHLVRDEAGPVAAGLTMAIYLTHPVLLESTSALIQNLPQVLCVLLTVLALLRWRFARQSMTLRGWGPIFALAIVGFYTREDTIMILPAIIALQYVRWRVHGDVPPPSRALMVALVGTLAVLASIHAMAVPFVWIFDESVSAIATLGVRVPLYAPVRTALVMFGNGLVLPGATAFVVLTQVAGLMQAIRRPTSRGAWLWMSGGVLLVAFSLPLALASDLRATRLHLAVAAAAVMLGGGLTSLMSLARPRGRHAVVVAALVIVAGLAAQIAAQRNLFATRFEPCSDSTVWFDQFLPTWPAISDDVRAWIPTKIAACASGEALFINDSIGTVRWATNTGLAVDATSATLQLTGPHDRLCPSMASLNVDGATRAIDTCAPTLEVALTPTWRTWMRQAHRIDITPDASHAMPVVENVSVVRSR